MSGPISSKHNIYKAAGRKFRVVKKGCRIRISKRFGELTTLTEQLTQGHADAAKLKLEITNAKEKRQCVSEKMSELVKEFETLGDDLAKLEDEEDKLTQSNLHVRNNCNNVHDANLLDGLLEKTAKTRYDIIKERLDKKKATKHITKILELVTGGEKEEESDKKFEQISISSEENNKEKESRLLMTKAMNDDEGDDYLSDICDSLGEQMSLDGSLGEQISLDGSLGEEEHMLL